MARQRKGKLETEIKTIERDTTNIMTAIKAAGHSIALLRELAELEDRGNDLRRQLSEMVYTAQPALPDYSRAELARQARRDEREAKARVDEIKAEATARFAEAIKNHQIGAWRVLLGDMSWECKDKAPTMDMDQIAQEMGKIMVGKVDFDHAALGIDEINAKLYRAELDKIE